MSDPRYGGEAPALASDPGVLGRSPIMGQLSERSELFPAKSQTGRDDVKIHTNREARGWIGWSWCWGGVGLDWVELRLGLRGGVDLNSNFPIFGFSDQPLDWVKIHWMMVWVWGRGYVSPEWVCES